jgi:hypothetical protein
MRRSAALAVLATLLSWNLSYPSALRADDDWNKSDPGHQVPDKDANQARGGDL